MPSYHVVTFYESRTSTVSASFCLVERLKESAQVFCGGWLLLIVPGAENINQSEVSLTDWFPSLNSIENLSGLDRKLKIRKLSKKTFLKIFLICGQSPTKVSLLNYLFFLNFNLFHTHSEIGTNFVMKSPSWTLFPVSELFTAFMASVVTS